MEKEQSNLFNYISAFLIILLALLLRVTNISHFSVWYDEGISIEIARQNLSNLWHIAALDVHPPLYYYFLHFWMYVSKSLFWVRFLSVVLGIVSIIISYLFVSKLFSKKVALLSSLFLAISPLHLHYSQEIRMYSLLSCITSLSFLLLWEIQKNPFSKKLWFYYIINVAAGLFTHYYVIILFFGEYCYLLYIISKIEREKKSAYLLHLCFSVLFLFLLFLPLYRIFWEQFLENSLQGIYAPKVHLTAGLLIEWSQNVLLDLIPGFVFQNHIGSYNLIIKFILLFIFLFFLAFFYLLKAKKNEQLVFTILVCIIPITLTLFLIQIGGRFYARSFIIFLPIIFGVISYFILDINKVFGFVITLLLCSFLLPSSTNYLKVYVRDTTLPAFTVTKQTVNPDTAIIHTNPFSFAPFLYYDDNNPNEYLINSPDLTHFQKALWQKRLLKRDDSLLNKYTTVALILSDWSLTNDGKEKQKEIEDIFFSNGWVKIYDEKIGHFKWCLISVYERSK